MKRYDPSLAAKKYDEVMIECVNGEWVRYEEAYRLRQRVKELEKQVKIQGFNLRLRELDGSMDIDAVKDAERWRRIYQIYLDDVNKDRFLYNAIAASMAETGEPL